MSDVHYQDEYVNKTYNPIVDRRGGGGIKHSVKVQNMSIP